MNEDILKLDVSSSYSVSDELNSCIRNNGGHYSYPLKKLLGDCWFSPDLVNCSIEKTLVHKINNDKLACVSPMTAITLFERGWSSTDYKKNHNIPKVEIIWINFPKMTYYDSGYLDLHKKLLVGYYDKQGINIFDVHYVILDQQQYGELCEGSYVTYGVTVLVSEKDSEKLNDINLKSYFPESQYCPPVNLDIN